MSLKQKWDNYSVQQTARNEGLKEGMEKGIEIGIEKGLKQVSEQGIEEGIMKVKHEVALKLKQKGISIDDIIDITGLTEKQILDLKLP